MSPVHLKDMVLQLATHSGPGAAQRMEQFAMDAAVAVLDGRGVTVSTKMVLNRADGRGPYHLEPGDTLRATEVTGAMRFFTVNNNKDEVILSQSQRIAELLLEIDLLKRQ